MSVAEVALRMATQADAPGMQVLTATGEIDVTNAVEFTRDLRSRIGDQGAVLDLTDLDYVDSAGFAALDELVASCGIRIVLGERSKIRRAAALISLPFSDSVAAAT
jgi:anti-sigma B factor antagonist